MKRLTLASLLATGLAAVPALAARAPEAPWISVGETAVGGVSVGDEFPDFAIDSWLNFSEEADSIHDLRGRVVLIDFWRTW